MIRSSKYMEEHVTPKSYIVLVGHHNVSRVKIEVLDKEDLNI